MTLMPGLPSPASLKPLSLSGIERQLLVLTARAVNGYLLAAMQLPPFMTASWQQLQHDEEGNFTIAVTHWTLDFFLVSSF